jgi:hypothetical protein
MSKVKFSTRFFARLSGVVILFCVSSTLNIPLSAATKLNSAEAWVVSRVKLANMPNSTSLAPKSNEQLEALSSQN